MNQVTITLDEPTSSALGELAQQYWRSAQALVGEALRARLDVQSGHLEDIAAGIAEADRGEAISREEILRVAEGISARS